MKTSLLLTCLCASVISSVNGSSSSYLRGFSEDGTVGSYDNTTTTENDENEKNDDFGFDIQTRIVGGSIAKGEDFQYMVWLGGCGGSLIAPDIVMTAAHCRPINPRGVRIGGSTQLDGEVRYIVPGSATWYPRYNQYSTNYDIMLYKLSQPSTKTPVPLNDDGMVPSGTDELTVIGFGSTREGGSSSLDLRKVNVNYVSYNTCNGAYWGRVSRTTMFCAGTNGGGKDSCQGDSGGPLVNEDGVLVGITSWGNGCGQRNFPGVYTKISSFYPWIRQETCRMSDYVDEDFCDGVDIPPQNNGGSGSGSGSGSTSGGSSSSGTTYATCSFSAWLLNFFTCP